MDTILFDLDGTLIHSDTLNNDAYNYALEKFGYPQIFSPERRLTRKDLLFVKTEDLTNIIKLKQKYFTEIWLPYRLTINTVLIQRIRKISKDSCYIWTKANKNRVFSILKQCGLTNLFKAVLFDEKLNFYVSMQEIRKTVHSDEFIIYENDTVLFDGVPLQKIDHIIAGKFDVYAYHIKL